MRFNGFAVILSSFTFGAGGHGLDGEDADAMRDRLLALESEAGEMRRQLESLGVVAQKVEVETRRVGGAFHGVAAEVSALGPELLLEVVVLLALGVLVYAVSRGTTVRPASKGKGTRAGLAGAAPSRPNPCALHTEARQPVAVREKPVLQAAGNDDVWTALQKVTARHRVVDEPQEGRDQASVLPVGGSRNISEPVSRISLRPSWASAPVKKATPKVAHPWTRARQEKLPDHADSKGSGEFEIAAEAHEPRPDFKVEEIAESSLAFAFPPGLTLPLVETTQPSCEQKVEQSVGEQDEECVAQTTEKIGSGNILTEEDVHIEKVCQTDLQKFVELDDKQEQQTKEEKEKDSMGNEIPGLIDQNGEEVVSCSSSPTTGALLSSVPPAQEEAEPRAQDQTPDSSSTRKGRTRKVERSTVKRPAHGEKEALLEADDWVLSSPSLFARIQLTFKGLASSCALLHSPEMCPGAPAEKALHADGESSAAHEKHGSKKVRRQAAKQQRPAKTKVEQLPRWSVPRWPLGTRATIIVAVLCGIVLFGRMDWDMDDVTRVRKLADLREQHRLATERLGALRAEKTRLTRARALADLSAYVGDAEDALGSMLPEERVQWHGGQGKESPRAKPGESRAERLEGYQSDARALLEALVDISDEDFPQVVQTYTQVSDHWKMVLATEIGMQKRRKALLEEDAARADDAAAAEADGAE